MLGAQSWRAGSGLQWSHSLAEATKPPERGKPRAAAGDVRGLETVLGSGLGRGDRGPAGMGLEGQGVTDRKEMGLST